MSLKGQTSKGMYLAKHNLRGSPREQPSSPSPGSKYKAKTCLSSTRGISVGKGCIACGDFTCELSAAKSQVH